MTCLYEEIHNHVHDMTTIVKHFGVHHLELYKKIKKSGL